MKLQVVNINNELYLQKKSWYNIRWHKVEEVFQYENESAYAFRSRCCNKFHIKSIPIKK